MDFDNGSASFTAHAYILAYRKLGKTSIAPRKAKSIESVMKSNTGERSTGISGRSLATKKSDVVFINAS